MKQRLLALMKIGEKENMKELLTDGVLFLQRLGEFQRIEQAERGDKNEGLSHSLQPDKVTLKVNGEIINGVIGPIRTIDNVSKVDRLLYCMYGFNSSHAECKPNQMIDERCHNFGNTAVIIKDGKKFFERIVNACKEHGINSVNGKLVNYDTYSGEMGCFRKYDNFSYQNEFRFVFENSIIDRTYKFKIGALTDIAELYPLCSINNIVQVKH